MILLQVNLAFGDEPKIVYEGLYETEDTSIFAWFSIPIVGCVVQFVDHLLIARWIT